VEGPTHKYQQSVSLETAQLLVIKFSSGENQFVIR